MCAGINPKKIECIVNQINVRNLTYSRSLHLYCDRNGRMQLDKSGHASISTILLENIRYPSGGGLNKLIAKILHVEEDVILHFDRGINCLAPTAGLRFCCNNAYLLGRKYS